MDQEFRPVDQSFVDLGQRGRVVARQFDALPHFRREVGAFGGFDVEVQGVGGGGRGGPDGGVAGVGKRAGLPVAEAGDIVRGAAEGLGFGGSVAVGGVWLISWNVRERGGKCISCAGNTVV